MRIIAGSARGRTLVAPPGSRTRPTQDAVRESLFNILQQEVADARVLDLFAGSGALALESLSRGAQHAVLVDKSPATMQVIRRNIAHAGFDQQCTCLCCDWQAAMTRLRAQQACFDLVFLDPPYDLPVLDTACAELERAGLLAPQAILVLEHRTGDVLHPMLPLVQTDARKYGGTTLTILRREENHDADSDLSRQL